MTHVLLVGLQSGQEPGPQKPVIIHLVDGLGVLLLLADRHQRIEPVLGNAVRAVRIVFQNPALAFLAQGGTGHVGEHHLVGPGAGRAGVAVDDDAGFDQFGIIDGQAAGQIPTARMTDQMGAVDAEGAQRLVAMPDHRVHGVIVIGFGIAGIALAQFVDGEYMAPFRQIVHCPTPILNGVGAAGGSKIAAMEKHDDLAFAFFHVTGPDATHIGELFAFYGHTCLPKAIG